MAYSITLAETTHLKASPRQSAEIRAEGIPNTLIEDVPAGTVLTCDDIEWHEGRHVDLSRIDSDDHLRVQLKDRFGDTHGLRWYIWAQHVKIDEGLHDHLEELDSYTLSEEKKVAAAKAVATMSAAAIADEDSEQAKEDLGPLIRLPGLSNAVRLHAPIYYENGSGSKFAWGEATRGGSRLPIDDSNTAAIIAGARRMDIARDLAAQPLTVNSWYRPPKVNRKVGGASRSRHIVGDAVDFRGANLNLSDFFYEMKGHPVLSRGGLAVGNGFIHTDPWGMRRWLYRGGPRVNLW